MICSTGRRGDKKVRMGKEGRKRGEDSSDDKGNPFSSLLCVFAAPGRPHATLLPNLKNLICSQGGRDKEMGTKEMVQVESGLVTPQNRDRIR